jgi:Ca2+-binding RTX toxin-like protein
VQLQTARVGKATVYLGVPAVLFGGDGNDTLNASGSTASNILVGGPGNDTLQGGRGRDILIGGLGADVLRAGSDDQILIGGTTDFDNDLTALAALRAEWGRTDASYQARVDHLLGTLADGLNGPYFLNASTVHDDAAIDNLYGGSGNDWFLALTGGAFADVLHNRGKNEIVTPLS